MQASRAVLVVVTVVHLAAQLGAPGGTVTEVTQPLLMPALAAVLVTATAAPRPVLVRIVLVALFFSWLGDSSRGSATRCRAWSVTTPASW